MKGIKMLMKVKKIKEKLPEEKMPPMLRHQHVNNNSDTNNKTKNQRLTTNNMMARIRISQIHPSQREQIKIHLLTKKTLVLISILNSPLLKL